jgi:hypothetical protein
LAEKADVKTRRVSDNSDPVGAVCGLGLRRARKRGNRRARKSPAAQ